MLSVHATAAFFGAAQTGGLPVWKATVSAGIELRGKLAFILLHALSKTLFDTG
jgi:hypothetical protein